MTTDAPVRKGAAKDDQEQAARDAFGSRLEALRVERGIRSQTALAKKAALERSVVTRLINGDNRANIDQISRLAAALDCSPAELLGESAGSYALSDASGNVSREQESGGYQVKTAESVIVATRLDDVLPGLDKKARYELMQECLGLIDKRAHRRPSKLGAG